MSDALEVTLIGLRCIANGEAHMTFAVHKDDVPKVGHLMGKVGQAFGIALARINYTTGELSPVSPADQTQTGNIGVLSSLDTPTEANNSLGGTQLPPSECTTDTRTTPEAELKQSPGPSHGRLAAIWLQRNDVQLYMHKTYCTPRNFDGVKGKVKELLRIDSLKEIIEGTEPFADFKALQLNFNIWLNDPKYR